MGSKVEKWLRFAVLLPILASLLFLIGQQPLSDSQLRQIIADWLGYPVDQLQFKDYGIWDIPHIVFNPTEPTQREDYRVQEYEVILPNNMVYYVDIDRYTGFIYNAGNLIQIPNLTIDRMLPPDQAIVLARQYLQRYFIWVDTSDWEVEDVTPKVKNGWWTEVQPMISVDFVPSLQIPQLPEGVVFVNEAIGCEITIDAVKGDLVGFKVIYTQIEFPLEPVITPEEAKAIARQYLAGKGIQVRCDGELYSLMLAPEIEMTYARLAYMFGFCYPPLPSEDAYITVAVGVDAHTGEVVYAEIPPASLR